MIRFNEYKVGYVSDVVGPEIVRLSDVGGLAPKKELKGPWRHIRFTRSRNRIGFTMKGIYMPLVEKVEAKLFELGCTALDFHVDDTNTWCAIQFRASNAVAGYLAQIFPCREGKDLPLVCNSDGVLLSGGAALVVKPENSIRQEEATPVVVTQPQLSGPC